MTELLYNIHRLLFRANLPIPEWLDKYLDEDLYISRISHQKPYTANPELFGLDQKWVDRRRRWYLIQVVRLAKEAESAAFKRLSKEQTNHNARIFNEARETLRKAQANLNLFKVGREYQRINFEELKQYSLLSVVKGYGINVIRAGGDRHRCVCPFHNDKNPSLVIYPDNRWRCFGCEKYGDVVDFIKEYEQIGTVEAAKKLL